MRIDWFSQIGSDRAMNCDAGCYGMTEQAIALAIVDAAESEKAQEFARYWAETLVNAAITFGYSKDASRIFCELANTQSELRHKFLHAIASYARCKLGGRSVFNQIKQPQIKQFKAIVAEQPLKHRALADSRQIVEAWMCVKR